MVSTASPAMNLVMAQHGLLHAQNCTNANCDLQSCRRIKSLREHVRNCSRTCSDEADVESKQEEQGLNNVNGTCPTCIEYWDLVKLHAKTCKDANCPIAKCKELRPSSLRKKLMARVSRSKSGSSIEVSDSAESAVTDLNAGSQLVNGSGTILLARPKPYSKSPHTSETMSEAKAEGDSMVFTSTSSGSNKGSFVKVGQNKQVPILAADEAYSHTANIHGAASNMANPMYEDEEMGQIPERKSWFSCGI